VQAEADHHDRRGEQQCPWPEEIATAARWIYPIGGGRPCRDEVGPRCDRLPL